MSVELDHPCLSEQQAEELKRLGPLRETYASDPSSRRRYTRVLWIGFTFFLLLGLLLVIVPFLPPPTHLQPEDVALPSLAPTDGFRGSQSSGVVATGRTLHGCAMTMDEFIALMELKSPPAPQDQLEAFETELGVGLPDDYRQFLVQTNGGFIRGWYRFKGPTPEGKTRFAFVHHVCGFREELHFSLRFNRECCLSGESQFPRALLWIMDDPGGNGICIGLTGKYRGRVYFWIHDMQPDPEEWDGQIETASNVILLANSFTDFVAGIGPRDASDDE